MDYAALKTEIQTDPLALGYAANVASGNDSAIAEALNLVRGTISIDRQIVDSHEVIDATAAAEWAALTAGEKQRYQTIVGAGKVNLENANVRAAFSAMFAAGTATRAALIAMLTQTGSRAGQLGFGTVNFLDVAKALRG